LAAGAATALIGIAVLLPAPAVSQPTAPTPYFGDLHNHTRFSDGWEGTPADAYAHAEAAGADWLATSDHNFMLTQEEWARTKHMANAATSTDFGAIAASEYWIANGFGEVIVLGVDDLVNTANWRRGNPGLSRHEVIGHFYDWLASHDGAVGHWPHPGLYGDLDHFEGYTRSRDRAMASIEIHNYGSWVGAPANWGVHDYEEWYVEALDAGWHVMPAAVSDTHSPDWISGSPVRTVLLAASRSPGDLLDALRASHGYATLDENLVVDFRLNGAVMGSILNDAPSYMAQISVSDPDGTPKDAITKIEIVADGGDVVARRAFDATDVSWSVSLPSSGRRYFYVRITTASDVSGGEGVTAWTAPVWTGR
jgi:hypothetical protein